MGAREYGALCKRHAEELGIKQGRLAIRLMRAFALEEDEERSFDATAIRLIYDGRRKIDDKLFDKLNQILGIERDEAEYTLGVWPSGFDLAGYRRLRQIAGANELTGYSGPALPILPIPADLDDLIGPLRPGLATVLPLRDRWRRSDRRPLEVAA